MSKSDGQKSPMANSDVPESLLWDLRVRSRNLQEGVLTPKDVDKHLATLPDLAAQCDPLGLAQPAIGGDEDDEDEDEDEDEED